MEESVERIQRDVTFAILKHTSDACGIIGDYNADSIKTGEGGKLISNLDLHAFDGPIINPIRDQELDLPTPKAGHPRAVEDGVPQDVPLDLCDWSTATAIANDRYSTVGSGAGLAADR